MTTTSRHDGQRSTRARTIPAVAPVAHAIRAALAVSSTMLALSAPAWAADTCRHLKDAHATPTCSGTLQGRTVASPTAPVDLTRVQDAAPAPDSVVQADMRWTGAAASVVVGDGQHGLDAPAAHGDVDHVDDVSVATAFGQASGVFLAPVIPTGDINVYGQVITSSDITDLNNAIGGAINADAETSDGAALAVGALAVGLNVTTLTNYGDIAALAISESGGDAQAYAALADGSGSGIGLLINDGDLSAVATAGDGNQATATGAYVYANVASIFNDATSSATATAGVGGTALARGARAYGQYSAVSSYGGLTADATAAGGTAAAHGIDAIGYLGASVYNAGDVRATATAAGGVADARGTYSIGMISNAYTTNVGTITAEATADSATATGVTNAALYLGDAITVNAGDIHAVAVGGLAPYGDVEAVAMGIYNFALYYDSIVDNDGTVDATALATTDINGTTGFLQAKAIGVQAIAAYGYGETVVANTGDIHATAVTSQGYASAWGAVAEAGFYGSASIQNDALITSDARTGVGVAMAVGAYVLSVAGTSEVINNGDILATASAERGIVNVSVDYADATGVKLVSLPYGGGSALVANQGSIEAHTTIAGGIGYATGVNVFAQDTTVANAADAYITATVEAELFGGAFATGVEAGGVTSVDVANDGTITAYAHANAYSDGTNGFYGAAGAGGIYANASAYGNATVVNHGDVNAIAIADNSVSWAQGGAGATGIDAYARYDASITNTGDVNAVAESQFGIVGAFGVTARGKYSSHIVNTAGSSVVAYASVGSLADDQYAGTAVAFGTQIYKSGMHDAVTLNAGSIVARAVVTPDGTGTPIGSVAQAWGSSIGYNSGIFAGTLENIGSIEASASADFGYATAYGAFVRALDDSHVSNDGGTIHAMAAADGGDAFAVGAYAYAVHAQVAYNCDPQGYNCDYSHPVVTLVGGDALVTNSGDIVAAATANGGTGASYGAVVLGVDVARIDNTGNIFARTDADDAVANGALVTSFTHDATIVNSGDIGGMATGTTALAYGAQISGQGNTNVSNTGTITAGAYGIDATAIALAMDGTGQNVLDNTGTIAAFGDGDRLAIASTGGAAALLGNHGLIVGAIRTGDAADVLDNAAGGTWRAVGVSDFGAGADQIVNHGTIILDDATVRLGGDGDGDIFENAGTIAAFGTGNVIDLRGGSPFDNNGVISFVDGAADDRLTILGDFAGDGALVLDVSGLHQGGDQLYIDGNVSGASTQVLDVDLVDLPATANVDIPLIHVSGDSVASNFSLGQVHYGADGFLSMSFGLNSAIDPTNASSDVVSLGVSVDGLNGMGSTAAALAPGAQSLVNAGIGTWRQRMGVVPRDGGKVGISPWLRMFSSSGDVDLAHSGNFGPGGDFDFHQSNHGWELGLDTRPGANLDVGVLIASADGSQHLASGSGSDRLTGKTFGFYGTWLADGGFYLDASLRWTGIDARLRSAGGEQRATASADAFNVEAGFTAWSLSNGVDIVPQLQYTHTRVSDITPIRGSQAAFVGDGGSSSRARVGIAFDKRFQRNGFEWTPYGSVNILHEFDGEYGYAINGGLLGTTRADGTSAMVELGLGARRGNFSVTGGASWTGGGAQQGTLGGQLVLRYGW